jgi:MFS family permease
MILGSISISLLPTYQTIGIASSIIFVFLRFIQGIAIGGNLGFSVINLEQAKENSKYYSSSFASVGILGGNLIGMLVTACLNYIYCESELLQYAWRIPFWGGFILALPVLLQLNKIKHLKFNVEDKSDNITTLLKTNYKTIFQGICLSMIDMIPFYTFFVFIPNYNIMILRHTSSNVWMLKCMTMAIMILFIPVFGKLADKYGAIKILTFTCCCLILSNFVTQIYAWSVCFGLTMASCYGCLYGFIAMLFPKKNRATLSSLVVSLGGLVGNAIPSIETAILKYGHIDKVGYLIVFAAILGLCSLVFVQKSKDE